MKKFFNVLVVFAAVFAPASAMAGGLLQGNSMPEIVRKPLTEEQAVHAFHYIKMRHMADPLTCSVEYATRGGVPAGVPRICYEGPLVLDTGIKQVRLVRQKSAYGLEEMLRALDWLDDEHFWEVHTLYQKSDVRTFEDLLSAFAERQSVEQLRKNLNLLKVIDLQHEEAALRFQHIG